MAALKHKPQHFFRIFSLLWHYAFFTLLETFSSNEIRIPRKKEEKVSSTTMHQVQQLNWVKANLMLWQYVCKPILQFLYAVPNPLQQSLLFLLSWNPNFVRKKGSQGAILKCRYFSLTLLFFQSTVSLDIIDTIPVGKKKQEIMAALQYKPQPQ